MSSKCSIYGDAFVQIKIPSQLFPSDLYLKRMFAAVRNIK